MKVTLKTGMTYPRHSGPRYEAGTSLDVPDATAADWITRGIAASAKGGESPKPPAPAPPAPVPKGKK